MKVKTDLLNTTLAQAAMGAELLLYSKCYRKCRTNYEKRALKIQINSSAVLRTT
jgi:hypothetical protein